MPLGMVPFVTVRIVAPLIATTAGARRAPASRLGVGCRSTLLGAGWPASGVSETAKPVTATADASARREMFVSDTAFLPERR